MAIVPPTDRVVRNDYPETDFKPMAETDWHRDLMLELIETLKAYFRGQPRVYVSGNLLVFYERGNKRRHVSPDVFMVRGVPNRLRPNYLVWEEGKGPEVVIELTSSSTRREDVHKKFHLYQDTLKVKEYFLFDPDGDYLDPPLLGYRLLKGKYHRIRPVAGRLPSRVLGLHLERHDKQLRLYDPSAGRWLPTPAEEVVLAAAARDEAEAARERADAAREVAEAARRQAEAARQRVEEDNERLRRELDALRRRPPTQP